MIRNLEHAQQLIKLHKFNHAIKELDTLLAENPDNAFAWAFRALACMSIERNVEALESAEKGVGLAPDSGYNYFVLAYVHYHVTNDYRQSEKIIKTALSIDPENTGYLGLYAEIKMVMKQYQAALELCDRGLAIDPEDADLRKVKALVLAIIGKRKESADGIREVMSEDPEDQDNFAAAGWVHLMNGEYKEALSAFKESLRIEPGHESAKAGLVEALKARNVFFRFYLKYIYWLQRQNTIVRIGIIVGAVVLARLMALVPELSPVVIVYGIFALSTWFIDPLFNLSLRFNRYGRYALTRVERITADLVAVFLLIAAGLAITFAFVDTSALIFGAFAFLAAILPVSGLNTVKTESPRNYRKYVAGLIVLGVFQLIALLFLLGGWAAGANFFFALVIVGSLLSSWLIVILRN